MVRERTGSRRISAVLGRPGTHAVASTYSRRQEKSTTLRALFCPTSRLWLYHHSSHWLAVAYPLYPPPTALVSHASNPHTGTSPKPPRRTPSRRSPAPRWSLIAPGPFIEHAVKVEPSDCKHPQLMYEAKLLKHLSGGTPLDAADGGPMFFYFLLAIISQFQSVSIMDEVVLRTSSTSGEGD